MAYTPTRPPLAESSAELRARIPGWGADLDPTNRPSVPRLLFDPAATGAHWEFPERQPELLPRERSIEHAILTPVFGTTCPTGVRSELGRHGFSSRIGRKRADLVLQAIDPLIVAWPWVVAGGGAFVAVRRLAVSRRP